MIVWKDTNHAVFDLVRASGAGAEPGSLHSLVSLVFPHFLEETQMRRRGEKPRRLKEESKPRKKMKENLGKCLIRGSKSEEMDEKREDPAMNKR